MDNKFTRQAQNALKLAKIQQNPVDMVILEQNICWWVYLKSRRELREKFFRSLKWRKTD